MTTVDAFLIPTTSLVVTDHADPPPAAVAVPATLTVATVTRSAGARTMRVGVDAREAMHVTAWVIADGQAHRLVDKDTGVGIRVFERPVPAAVPAGTGHVTVRLVDARGNRVTLRTKVQLPTV